MGGALLSIWGDTRLHTHVFSNQPLQPIKRPSRRIPSLTCCLFFVGLEPSQVIEDIKSTAYSGKVFCCLICFTPPFPAKTSDKILQQKYHASHLQVNHFVWGKSSFLRRNQKNIELVPCRWFFHLSRLVSI